MDSVNVVEYKFKIPKISSSTIQNKLGPNENIFIQGKREIFQVGSDLL